MFPFGENSRDMDAVEQFEEALNTGQHWLTIVPHRNSDGSVDMEVNLHGHFLATAASESPEDVREGLVELFRGVALALQQGALAANSG